MPSKMRSFTTREVPWMKLGTVIDHDVDSREAAALGGLDFEVRLDPVMRFGPRATHDEDDGAGDGDVYAAIPDRFAMTRADTGAVLDIVSGVYTPLQYAEAFSFMDAVNPRYVAAGTLLGGRQAFMVVQHPGLTTLDLDLGGVADPHELYMLLRTSHDRSRGLEVVMMPLRNACMNQLGLASMTAEVEWRWSVRHIGKPAEKLVEARVALGRAERYAESFAESARRLAETDLLLEDARNVLDAVLDDRARREETRDAIIGAWQESELVGFPGTGWGLVNAVSEHLQWHRESASRTPQSRFIDGVDGRTRITVNKTAQLLLRRRAGR